MLWQDQQKIKSPADLRKTLKTSAKPDIPRVLGQTVADAVVACLTGLEEDDHSGVLNDKDGVVMGSIYITRVVKRLEEISI